MRQTVTQITNTCCMVPLSGTQSASSIFSMFWAMFDGDTIVTTEFSNLSNQTIEQVYKNATKSVKSCTSKF